MLIPLDRPFDLASTLECGQAFRWRREADRNGWYQGVVFDNIVELRREPDGIEFLCAPDDESALEPLLRDYLCLDDDLEAIYRSIGVDEHIDAVIGRYRGMRILRQDPWECLVSFVCSANSNIRRISTNMEDIAGAFGRPVWLGKRVRHTFPRPGDLAGAGEQPLRKLGLGFRAKYVAAVSTAVANGTVDLFALRESSYGEALEALTALPGVGDKVANCVLLFSLDKPEAFPVDVWIQRVMREWYADEFGKSTDRKNSKTRMRLWAQNYFKSYAGYANQYLFHDIRLRSRNSDGNSG